MKSKNAQRISDVIRQSKLNFVMIGKELSEWESQGGVERDLFIFLSIFRSTQASQNALHAYLIEWE